MCGGLVCRTWEVGLMRRYVWLWCVTKGTGEICGYSLKTKVFMDGAFRFAVYTVQLQRWIPYGSMGYKHVYTTDIYFKLMETNFFLPTNKIFFIFTKMMVTQVAHKVHDEMFSNVIHTVQVTCTIARCLLYTSRCV